MARTTKRWVPLPRLTVVSSRLLEVAVYFFAPSTHSSMRAMVPLTVAAASTRTGELTLEPLPGSHMWIPSELGRLHRIGTTTRAFGLDAMVYGEPGTAVMLVCVTVYA